VAPPAPRKRWQHSGERPSYGTPKPVEAPPPYEIAEDFNKGLLAIVRRNDKFKFFIDWQRDVRWKPFLDAIRGSGFRSVQLASGMWSPPHSSKPESVLAFVKAMGGRVAVSPAAHAAMVDVPQRPAGPALVVRRATGRPGVEMVDSAGDADALYKFAKALWDSGFRGEKNPRTGRYERYYATSVVPLDRLLATPMASEIFVPEDVMVDVVAARGTREASRAASGVPCHLLPAPDGMKYMPFQCAGIMFAAERPGTIIGDDMGLGKTIQAIGVINTRPEIGSVVIVAPASLLRNWAGELRAWLVRPARVYVAETNDPVPPDANIVIVNYERLIDRTETVKDYGDAQPVHAVEQTARGFAIRNTASGRIVASGMRSAQRAQEMLEQIIDLGEPHPTEPKSRVGTRAQYSRWAERKRAGAFYVVDATWSDARLPGPRDKIRPKEIKVERPSQVFRDLMARSWDLLVVDEAQRIKESGGPQQKTRTAVLGEEEEGGDRQNPIWRMVKPGLRQRASRAILLTGTPIPNRIIEIWPFLRATAPEVFNSYWKFAFRYAGPQQKSVGNRTFWEFKGASNVEELQDLMRSTVMVRRMKAQVLTELPAKTRQAIPLHVPEAIELMVNYAMERAAERAANDRERDDDWRDDSSYEQQMMEDAENLQALIAQAKAAGNIVEYNILAQRLNELVSVAFRDTSRMRAAIAVLKVPYVVDHLESMFDSGIECVVVMAHHHEVQDAIFAAIEKRFGAGSAVLHRGGLSNAEKDAAVRRFQGVSKAKSPTGQAIPHDPKARVFVGSILASGVGITLTRASHIVFAELDWVPGNVSQAEDRIHRIGQENPVLVQHLVVDGTLDAKLVNTIIRKQEIADRALDLLHLPMEVAMQMARDGKPVPAEILDAALAAIGSAGDARTSDEKWAWQTIIGCRNGQIAPAVPLDAWELAELAALAAKNGQLSDSAWVRAKALAIKIRGGRPAEITATSPVRGPANAVEEWAAGAIAYLASQDADRARFDNAVGFTGSDSSQGHALAMLLSVNAATDADWRKAVQIAMHYARTQAPPPPDVVEAIEAIRAERSAKSAEAKKAVAKLVGAAAPVTRPNGARRRLKAAAPVRKRRRR
jgi:hypothetical protein